VAFARHARKRWAIVVVQRLVIAVAGPGEWPIGNAWDDTELLLPAGAPEQFSDALTGSWRSPELAEGAIPVRDALSTLPVALMTGPADSSQPLFRATA